MCDAGSGEQVLEVDRRLRGELVVLANLENVRDADEDPARRLLQGEELDVGGEGPRDHGERLHLLRGLHFLEGQNNRVLVVLLCLAARLGRGCKDQRVQAARRKRGALGAVGHAAAAVCLVQGFANSTSIVHQGPPVNHDLDLSAAKTSRGLGAIREQGQLPLFVPNSNRRHDRVVIGGDALLAARDLGRGHARALEHVPAVRVRPEFLPRAEILCSQPHHDVLRAAVPRGDRAHGPLVVQAAAVGVEPELNVPPGVCGFCGIVPEGLPDLLHNGTSEVLRRTGVLHRV